jgi:hypothetical protein
LAAALASAGVAEDQEHRRLYLLFAGAFGMTAALIKPSGILLECGRPRRTSNGSRCCSSARRRSASAAPVQQRGAGMAG